MFRQLFAACILLTCISCKVYHESPDFEEIYPVEKPAGVLPGVVNLYFLGTAGIYLEAEGVSLLADPFLSNPFPWHLISPFPVRIEKERIDRVLMPLVGATSLQALLVTHSHYDHAMDVPYIVQRYRPTCIYGNETLRNALNAEARGRFCLDGKINDSSTTVPMWRHAAPRLRIAAIQSEHFPHADIPLIGHWSYADGAYEQPQWPSPSRLYEWLEGDTYSFVIDILSPVTPEVPIFRIFYLPSASTHPTGTPPESMLCEKSVDLAILGAAQLDWDDNYPGDVLRNINPEAVLFVHWDNFVDQYRTQRAMNFRVEPAELARRARNATPAGTKIYWPFRGSLLQLELPMRNTRPATASEC